jgi:DNA helicase-2/ATP-dependent DNA helicase PcrA
MIGERVAGDPSEQQHAVMDHPLTAPALVDAGAGTGKTYTIVERVVQLNAKPESAGGCPASSILALTFSRKAAAELRGRIMRRLDPGVEPPQCDTFHAFALSMLKEQAFDLDLSPDFEVINDVDARVKFWKAFDDLLSGKVGIDATSLPLRFGVAERLRPALFDVRAQLRDREEMIDEFSRRAREAADAFARTPYRELRQQLKTKLKVVYTIDDASFAKENAEELARIEAAAGLFRRFDQQLRERDVLTYADLLQIARHIIRSRPTVAAALRQRYRHCIVDEYQDTDPRQVALLAAIFGDGLERVMAVGDPRQSIYAFRGARPDNVADFGKLPSCILYPLTHNRRSQQEILDFAHAVIGAHFDDVQPLTAVRGAAGEEVIHVKSRWDNGQEPWPNAARTRELEARYVARKIVALLASGRRIERADTPGEFEPLAPRHVAILSRNKTQLQPLLDELNEANLPFRQYGGAGFYDAPEVLDALAWFRLVAEPLDDNAVARVVESPATGLCDGAVAVLCKGMREDGGRLARRALVDELPPELDADARERLERLRDTVKALAEHAGAPLAVAWDAMLDRAGLLLSADLRSGARRDQARANLEKLSAMVRAFAVRNPGARVVDFVRYVRELNNANADDQEADPPATDAIGVMTIHAAKGLEWPIVFMIDVWPPRPHDKTTVRIDAASGAFLVSEGTNGLKPFHAESVDRQDDGAGMVPVDDERRKNDDEFEDRRLFYVAVTRARDELFISGRRRPPSGANPDGKVHDYLQLALDWVKRRGWSTVEEDEPGPGRFVPAGAVVPAPPLPLADFIRDGRSRPLVMVPTLSFTSLAHFEKCPRSINYRLAYRLPGLAGPFESDDDEERGRPPDSLLSLGAYGQLVHRALELWAGEPGKRGAASVSQAVRELDVKASRAERDRAIRSVDVVVDAFAGWRPLRAEAPFTLDFDGIALSGFIDLIAEDPSGKIFLIDWKTGVTPAGAYALQLALYRHAAVEAYGYALSGCRIVRITDAACVLEEVALPSAEEIRARIHAVAEGIRRADMTATPGEHCNACAYRDAPCLDFLR